MPFERIQIHPMASVVDEPARNGAVVDPALDDGYRELDDRLDRWAYYRRRANIVPTGCAGSQLTKLIGESAEIAANSDRVKAARKVAWRIRAEIADRIGSHRRLAKQYNEAGDHYGAATHRDAIEALTERLKAEPATTHQLPLASMIFGSGYIPERDFDEEEATNTAVLKLSAHFREILERNYLNDLPQDVNARQMGMSLSTFKRRIKSAKAILRCTVNSV